MEATGANIKSLIKANGLKISEIQAVYGFNTPQSIFKWMRGEAMPSVDNLVILKGTKHKTEAELFINYLLRGEVSAKLTTEFPYVCFNTAAVQYLPEELAKSDLCLLSDDIKNRIYMINTFDGEAIAAEIDAMVEVKTSR